jgi:sugar/nucleoside kinase (ribokinase family)
LPDYPRLLTTLRDRGFQVAVDTGWPPHNWDSALREATHRWLGDCDWLLLNEVETLGLANQDVSRRRPARWRRVSAAGAAALSNAAPMAPGGGRQTRASRAGETGRGHRHHRRRRQF